MNYFDRQLPRTMEQAFGPHTNRSDLDPMPDPARSLIRPVLAYAAVLVVSVGLFLFLSKVAA